MVKGQEPPNGDVVRRLVEHIQSAGLHVGDRLPSIRELAAKLKVGTNVVRYGMIQAQTMGLVRVHPRSGAFVQSLDFAPLVNALESTLTTLRKRIASFEAQTELAASTDFPPRE